MTPAAVIDAVGGLALFLLAMLMMAEGLTVFAGGALARLLRSWTSTPRRGVLTGMLVTGLVQSSSAVTVATIGFVNAGILTLRQALGVIYGTNVGTTMTGWLVSLVGVGVRIEELALPILTVGVALRLLASERRAQGLGQAVAGFGLFFLGLAVLKAGFTGLAAAYAAHLAAGGAGGPPVVFVGVGFIATVLTQSSSAAIALILTAASGGVLAIEAAAAAVIGANLGTTSTAALAALRATPAARRLALGHIAFNALAGLVALALLPGLLWLVDRLADWLTLEGSPAALLALFHTVFNVLGVVLLLPLTGGLATALERLFRSAEEDLARPQHLDATLATTPALAVAALRAELLRLRALVAGLIEGASGGALAAGAIARRAAAASALGTAVGAFVAAARTATMPREVGDDLARALRVARYLAESARHAAAVARVRRAARAAPTAPLPAALGALLDAVVVCAGPREESGSAGAAEHFALRYQAAKSAVLAAAVDRTLPLEAADALLDDCSAVRRMVEQLAKADQQLGTFAAPAPATAAVAAVAP